ncbi:MAG: WecB/TagA/CpsF family glycosyltransferase [Myxococcota bacterium]|nr:WecB/TagA/CpsF family glycosyltransferase [Myxococcota bacterium]
MKACPNGEIRSDDPIGASCGRGAQDPSGAPLPAAPEQFAVDGVPITDLTMADALAFARESLDDPAHTRVVYFVNAHTLNLASRDPDYRRVLCTADRVFGDGAGVRWAARIRYARRLLDNVNGTDFVPALFAALAGQGYRYYLLGTSPAANPRAAAHAREAFPGWEQVGSHHGYLEGSDARVVAEINAARPHLLLVGMGNPLQERWLHDHRESLRVPLCLGVGGLMDYWAGDLDRAPHWLRRLGFEWVHLMLRQPHKVPRYLIGNPAFLLRQAAARLGLSA